MARVTKRMIRPELFESRLFYPRTCRQKVIYTGIVVAMSDDHGKSVDDPVVLRAKLFPFDDFTIDEIKDDLKALNDCGLIKQYSVDGEDYIIIPSWGDDQNQRKDRMKESEYPDPVDINKPLGDIPPSNGNQVATKDRVVQYSLGQCSSVKSSIVQSSTKTEGEISLENVDNFLDIKKYDSLNSILENLKKDSVNLQMINDLITQAVKDRFEKITSEFANNEVLDDKSIGILLHNIPDEYVKIYWEFSDGDITPFDICMVGLTRLKYHLKSPPDGGIQNVIGFTIRGITGNDCYLLRPTAAEEELGGSDWKIIDTKNNLKYLKLDKQRKSV